MSLLERLLGRSRPKELPKVLTVDTASSPVDGEAPRVYGDQPLRKQWAEDVLRSEGVPINPHLPMIESEAEVVLRSPKEVADRALALTMVAFKGEGLEHDRVQSLVKERSARKFFTPDELAFIDDPAPSMHARIQFSWRYEAVWVLLWSLKKVEGNLGAPRGTCDPGAVALIVRDTLDLTDSGMRSTNDVLNEADLIYRYHWAVRDAELNGQEAPAGLDSGVTMERHHALNWLIGYNERAGWDEVTTDT